MVFCDDLSAKYTHFIISQPVVDFFPVSSRFDDFFIFHLAEVLTGVQAHSDLDGQIGPLLSFYLSCPYLGYVAVIELEEEKVMPGRNIPAGWSMIWRSFNWLSRALQQRLRPAPDGD